MTYLTCGKTCVTGNCDEINASYWPANSNARRRNTLRRLSAKNPYADTRVSRGERATPPALALAGLWQIERARMQQRGSYKQNDHRAGLSTTYSVQRHASALPIQGHDLASEDEYQRASSDHPDPLRELPKKQLYRHPVNA